MIKIIDPHLHFFNLSLGQYHWLTKESGPDWPNIDKIRQNHQYEDLSNPIFEVAKFVHIEAGFNNQHPEYELDWLSKSIPQQIPYQAIAFIRIDSEPTVFNQQLSVLLQFKGFKGVRDITEGLDYKRLLTKNARLNLLTMAKYHLVFEAQVELSYEKVASILSSIASQAPSLSIVLNHAGFMVQQTDYTTAVTKLSQNDNIYIKFSGQEHCVKALNNVEKLSLLLKTFGEDRVMFASNYPVCLMRNSYLEVWNNYKTLVDNLGIWHKLSYANAQRVYFK